MADINKLPKWARNEILRLRNDNASMAAALEQITSGLSPISWSEGFRGGDHGIPEHATIAFEVDGGRICVTLRDGRIEILGVWGYAPIDVRPDSPNSISVGAVRR